jgi:phage terminase large subunit-like protein
VVAQSAATIYTQYTPAVEIIASHIDKMSNEDVAVLVSIQTNYDKVYNEFKDLQDGKVNLREIAMDYTLFYETFTQLEDDYIKVVSIVDKYSMLFSPVEKTKLNMFKRACVTLHTEFNRINDQLKKNDRTAAIVTDITQLLQDTLIIANAVSTLALMIPK